MIVHSKHYRTAVREEWLMTTPELLLPPDQIRLYVMIEHHRWTSIREGRPLKPDVESDVS